MTDISIASRIWNLCHVLRDDGIVYHKYLSELTYLIFLKTASETGSEKLLPPGLRWGDLCNHGQKGLLGFYRKMLTTLGEDSGDADVREIFSFPTTVFSHDENLEKVVVGINAIDWHAAANDGLGEIYEALLERNATEARSGSGQYFTPRPLVDSVIRLLQPTLDDSIQDPAVGTGGFLISAHQYILRKGGTKQNASKPTSYSGAEIEHDTYRLCLMNMFLHGMSGKIIHGDALTDDASALPKADIIVANPPFGSSVGGARPRRRDLHFVTSNKQLMFLQHIYLGLKSGGRAGVVVPDNVISEGGIAKRIRVDLMEKCNLHTVLRLPEGLFYAPGVKTNVLFFFRGIKPRPTTHTWVYDLRSNMPKLGRGRAINESDFERFEACFGNDPYGDARGNSADPRWRRFDRDEIDKVGAPSGLTWLIRSDEPDASSIRSPTELIREATLYLQDALAALGELEVELPPSRLGPGIEE
jgi:type I restriction enzyme M protein